MATRRDEAETRKRSRREPNLQNIKSNRVETELQASRFRSLIYAPLERERKERKEEREREKEGKNTFDENIHPRFTRNDNRYITEIKFHFLPPSWPGTHNCGILNGRVVVAS